MDQVSLRAEVGRETGSGPTRRLRAAGKVPAVVYGRGIDPVSVAVEQRELYAALHTDAGLNAIINLEVDGSDYTTIAREIQRHPWRGEITHLDFLQISLDEAIESDVSLEFTGTPAGVTEGGIVESVQTSVVISSLPTLIPPSIAVDISALNIGDSLKVADLPEIEGVEYISDPESTLVTVQVPAAVIAEEAEEGLLEGEEAEAGEESAADAEEAGAEDEG
ncbi:MAG TPA: 50S ribosomal protein L25 [Acidimicrobiia bacterium]|nr:50S ribosomal protein L25 [Acidimicrobiia bacterium]